MHYEQQYLDLMHYIWNHGAVKQDRTGVGTKSIFGATMRFSLENDSIPLLTTKRVFWKTAAKEMLWFLTGKTNIRDLLLVNVRIWSDWPLDNYRKAINSDISQEEFENKIIEDEEFALKWGDLGPVYGTQWVNWPRYEMLPDTESGPLYKKMEQGVDQVSLLIDSLQKSPGSRRHIIEGWNVAELDQMALPPCHKTYQFYVADGKLSGLLYQRSCDLGLGFAFNVFSASLLIKMIAQQCGLEAGELIWNGGDVHLYLNHEALVEEQLSRTPAGNPKLKIIGKPASIFDYDIENFVVEDYEPQKHISAPVAV
jgi:thymidylate synthase